MGWLILLAGVLMVAGVYFLFRGRWYRRAGAVVLGFLGVATVLAGGYWVWFTHRARPVAVTEAWYQGVRYERRVVDDPRRLVIHIVRVDLRAAGVGLCVTAPDMAGSLPLKARLTSTFAREAGVQVAINANFYRPFYAGHPLNYYPHEGDPVQVCGLAAYHGQVYQAEPWNGGALYISADGKVSPDAPPAGEIYDAISGIYYCVRDGKDCMPVEGDGVAPRTALGVDRERRTLILMVVDGKQPGYSEGVSPGEVTRLMIAEGADAAISLDGGGSSTLVRQGADGRWGLVSSPSNFRMPWWERPVANHLGIRALPLR